LRASRTAVWILAAILVAAASLGAQERKFYPDDPVRVDRSLVDVPEVPASLELSDAYDALGHTFKDWGKSPLGTEAQDVNTLDEVADGAWFVNRHGSKRMSLEDLVRGPNTGDPPDPTQTWTVFRSKTQGVTPGFDIEDESGRRYVIKLDPVEVPEIASASEVISTKIFYAVGYHVAENYVVRVHPDRFAIKPGTQVEDSFGDKTTLTQFRFNRSIRLVPRLPDGTIRVTASKYVDGVPIGHRRYYETRSDDPNDVVPHEDRREQRGLRLFSAWLNHDDTRAQNTIDSWVEEGGRHYVRHYLLDFGSLLGSGSVSMQLPYYGFQYTFDFPTFKRNLLGLGFRVPEYRKAKWPEFPEYEPVGRFESELFDPARWKGNYPNPAFARMTGRDAFWAAKILMKFTREELEAIVATGEYSDPENARYLLQILVERQQKCGRFGINSVNPLDEFQLSGGALHFVNLSEKYGFVEGETRYDVQWFAFDNETGRRRDLSEKRTRRETSVSLPAAPSPEAFLVAEIRSVHGDYPHWGNAIAVTLRPAPAGYDIVGIERESPEASTFPVN
jgi:hypothetical protein